MIKFKYNTSPPHTFSSGPETNKPRDEIKIINICLNVESGIDLNLSMYFK